MHVNPAHVKMVVDVKTLHKGFNANAMQIS